jgi:penicillin V acylase-like amidase (Ntn superfamily)
MRNKLLLGIILILLTVAIGCSGSPTLSSPSPAGASLIPAGPDGACTSFCLDNGDHCVFGTNMDHGTFQVGQLFVNKRHVMKTAWESSTSGEYARWISLYGSVTFNMIGSQMVWGGMNEAGLMISTMSLVETEEPSPDERLPLAAPFWVQYQLDNASTIEDVIASDALVRVTNGYDHYLVCDRTGDCAVIEFLDGEMIVYTGPTLPTQALANSTYQDSLTALEDGNYWRVKAFGVIPGGAADAAGMIEDDWIIAVDGVELVGPESLETLHSIIAQHEVGDDVIFTVRRFEEADPITLSVRMAPLPEDTSRYVLPPGTPVQIISLGLVPGFPGDFLARFATAAEWVDTFEPASSEEAIAYAFDALEAVSVDDTIWSAVFDPANSRIYFHTFENPQIRYIDFAELDFSCNTPVTMLDVHAGGEGNISDDLVPYSHEMAIDHAVSVATDLWQVDVSALYVETMLVGFERFNCMEDNASALEAPALYVENHPPLLPPLVSWTGLMILRRFWPAIVLLAVVSMAFALTRSRIRRRRKP